MDGFDKHIKLCTLNGSNITPTGWRLILGGKKKNLTLFICIKNTAITGLENGS